MSVYKNFIKIEPTSEMANIAIYHARRRTAEIVRQFIPRNAPLSHLESNYIGALGEIAVYSYFGLDISLQDNYEKHEVDAGDIRVKNLVYDCERYMSFSH